MSQIPRRVVKRRLGTADICMVSVTRIRLALEAVLVLGWLAFVVNAVAPLGGLPDGFFESGLYYVLIVAATAGCLLRAASRRRERWAWTMIGVGLAAWTAGDLYYLLRLQDLPVVPVPSPADALYLAYFPLIYVGVVLLMRGRLGRTTHALWLDGMTAALTVAALASVILVDPIQSAGDELALASITNLSYPLGDVVLLALLTGFAAAQRFRLDRATLMLFCGLLAAAAADTLYLIQSDRGVYVEGGIIDALWAASLLLIGASAWRAAPVRRPSEAWRPIAALPLGCAAVTTLLLAFAVDRLGALGTLFAAAAVMTVLVRLAVTLRENARLLASASDAALTDALTGLSNRRALLLDAETLAGTASADDPLALVLFDLNGFKSYNDRFGHPAGDALLQQLGLRLQAVGEGHVRVYRLGGDEFALLARSDSFATAAVIERAVDALSEDAEGFSVSASFGAAFVPEEAETVAEALRIADIRLYSRKAAFYADHDQPHEALLRVLDSRDPASARTRALAAAIASEIAAAVGLDADIRRRVSLAALLRDVGTLAFPDHVAHPQRPLTDAERALVVQHPVIGERIVSAMPALRPLAPIVRSGYESWDGSGYPDGLAGERIPLESRIVAAGAARAQEILGDEGLARISAPKLDPRLAALAADASGAATDARAASAERA